MTEDYDGPCTDCKWKQECADIMRMDLDEFIEWSELCDEFERSEE